MSPSDPLHIGVLGGGQLGRMLALAGIPLGFRFRFLDPGGDTAPAAAVGPVVEGGWHETAPLEAFALGLDLVTWEFENVPVEAVRELGKGLPIFPPPAALEAAQDRWVEKETFRRLGIPVVASRPVSTEAELLAAVDLLGLPAVLKTRRMGYDGKGQVVLKTPADLPSAWDLLGGQPLLLEAFQPFHRELSLVVARGREGEVCAWPLVENVHRDGILRTSWVSGVDAALQGEAEAHGRRLLEALGYVGVLAVEFFHTSEGLVANEMAPRVHNSGHWTQDGSLTSQFENHIRAVAGLPLGPTGLGGGAAAMVNFIGGIPPRSEALQIGGEGVKVALHLYDKPPRRGRKVGHLNLVGADPERVREAMERAQVLADQYGEG